MPRSKALGDAWKSEAKDLGPGTKALTSSQDVMGIKSRKLDHEGVKLKVLKDTPRV